MNKVAQKYKGVKDISNFLQIKIPESLNLSKIEKDTQFILLESFELKLDGFWTCPV